MWNECLASLKEHKRKFLDNNGVSCNPRKAGGGVGRFKKQLRSNEHSLKPSKQIKNEAIFFKDSWQGKQWVAQFNAY